MMYGQMTAGSWIYIGTQWHRAVAPTRRSRPSRPSGSAGTLRGTLTVTGGCGGGWAAHSRSRVTMNDGVVLVVDVDASRLQRRVHDRYLDEWTSDIDAAVDRVLEAKRDRIPLSVGLVGNCAFVLPELLRRGLEIDIVTRPDVGARPAVVPPSGRRVRGMARVRRARPRRGSQTGRAPSMALHVEAMWGSKERWRRGLRLRQLDSQRGRTRAASCEPGSCLRVPCLPIFRPLFCEGKGP